MYPENRVFFQPNYNIIFLKIFTIAVENAHVFVCDMLLFCIPHRSIAVDVQTKHVHGNNLGGTTTAVVVVHDDNNKCIAMSVAYIAWTTNLLKTPLYYVSHVNIKQYNNICIHTYDMKCVPFLGSLWTFCMRTRHLERARVGVRAFRLMHLLMGPALCFSVSWESRLGRAQTGNGRLLEEVQRQTEIKSESCCTHVPFEYYCIFFKTRRRARPASPERIYWTECISCWQGAILTTMLATRNFSSKYDVHGKCLGNLRPIIIIRANGILYIGEDVVFIIILYFFRILLVFFFFLIRYPPLLNIWHVYIKKKKKKSWFETHDLGVYERVVHSTLYIYELMLLIPVCPLPAPGVRQKNKWGF